MGFAEVPRVADPPKQRELLRHHTEIVADILNWLFDSGQLVRTGPDSFIINAGSLAPPIPSTLVAVGNVYSVDLSWMASTGATSYRIYQGLAPGAEGPSPVLEVTGTTAAVIGLTPGTTYYFKVTAFNGIESGKSNEASAIPLLNSLDFSTYLNSLYLPFLDEVI